MNNQEYAKIIAKNLRNIFYRNGKTQAEVSRALGISKATLSSWMNGTRVPRMENIDILCHYFNVSRASIMEPHTYYKVPKKGRGTNPRHRSFFILFCKR